MKCGAKRGYYREKHSRYEKDKDYIKFIKSKKWNNKSQEIKLLDNHCCLVCKSLGLISPVYLEVHHIVKFRNDASLKLDNNNLITLCIAHHKMADSNKIKASELHKLIKLYRDTTEHNDILLL
jgi:HNH endonuclease|nr:MAG TPA: HNH endonuclease bacteriophage, HNH Endonuclease, DNA.52A [Caudoviricetes sp.]